MKMTDAATVSVFVNKNKKQKKRCSTRSQARFQIHRRCASASSNPDRQLGGEGPCGALWWQDEGEAHASAMAAIKSTPFAMHRPPLVWIRQAGGEGPSHAAAGGSTLRVDLERERERDWVREKDRLVGGKEMRERDGLVPLVAFMCYTF